MKITTRHVVTVLEINGRISASDSGTLLMDAIRKALAEGARNLLLDLHHVTYLDSTGVGELAGAARLAAGRHCELKLINLAPRVDDLLKITGLDSTLDIYTDEQEAMFTFTR